MPKPMPLLPPVITATLFFNFNGIVFMPAKLGYHSLVQKDISHKIQVTIVTVKLKPGSYSSENFLRNAIKKAKVMANSKPMKNQ